ncbi:MAG: hypothetical protein ACRC3H_07870 [Lachnospiraceae bacterium]
MTIKDELKTKQIITASAQEDAVYDLGDGIYALAFGGKDGKIGQQTAQWATGALQQVENSCDGIVMLGSEGNLCCGNEKASSPELFQQLTGVVRHYSKPIVTLMTGESYGFGYELALNSQAVLVSPEVSRFGYDLQSGSPVGGGLTAQIIDTYAIGDNVPGHDIVPFLKVLLNHIYMPKKYEDLKEAKEKGYLPKNAMVVEAEANILELGKQKVCHLYREGFSPSAEKVVKVTGTTGRAALEILLMNGHEGGFITDEIYPLLLAAANVIGGGDVPAKTMVSESRFLQLEAEAFKQTAGQNREEMV